MLVTADHRIEQLFATLKLAGLDLEATQLESISAILCIHGSSQAWERRFYSGVPPE